jgi:transcriptional regulator with XRE-family HTH domain
LKLPNLRTVRELHGWSQADLARTAGVSRDSISNYESGKREAWPATAQRIADALGVPLSKLEEANWRAVVLKQEADQLDVLVTAVEGARETLKQNRLDYTERFLTVLDEGLRETAEALHEAYQIETGQKKEEEQESTDDPLSTLLREWEAEKAV